MSYLAINGVIVPVAEAPKVAPTDIGTIAPAVGGQVRQSLIARKRTWDVTTGMMTETAANTLRSALLSGATVAVTGTWMGSVNAWPVMTGEKLGKSAALTFVLSFTLSEV